MARNAHPEVTRKRILDAAQRLFVEKGYDDTSIQDIIDALGDLSKGAIYHHFKSKKAIFVAVNQRDVATLNAKYDALAKRKDLNGRQKSYQCIWTDEEGMEHMRLNARYTSSLTDPQTLSENITFWTRDLPKTVRRFIDEGIEDGSLVTDHPQQIAEMFSLMSNIWFIPELYPGSPSEIRGRVEALAAMMNALGTPIFDQALIDNMVEAVEMLYNVTT